MTKFHTTLAAAALLVPFTFTVPAVAGDTATEVYQVVDAIHGELALMHKANGSKPVEDRGAPKVTERQPRHVFQKAREVMRKVELLHELNDIESEAVPDFPTHHVTPKEVHKFVSHLLEEVRELRPVFGVKAASPKAAKVSGKSPTDVYAYLDKVSHVLDGFDIRRTKAFDVYRTALTAIHELEQIRAKFGIKKKIQLKRHSGRTPEEAYAKTFELLADLKHLAEAKKDKFHLPGGIVMPNKRAGKVHAEDLMVMMNYLLAEIAAMKVELGIKTPMQFAMPRSGGVPTNVYDAIVMADLLVKQIEKGS